MAWNVCVNGSGDILVIPVGDDVPDGYNIDAVTANPNYLAELSARSKIVQPDQFLASFTDPEKLAILDASETDPTIRLMLMKLNTALVIDKGSQGVMDVIAYFVAQSLITQSRADEILR